MRTRHEKPAAIQFPDTPEHPGLNAELQYRLQLLRVLDGAVRMTEEAQESLSTSSWNKAMIWGHDWLIKGAIESIDSLGPLSNAAQKAELRDFIESLREAVPEEAA